MNEGKGSDRATEREAERLRRARLVLAGKAMQFAGSVVGALILFLGGGIWLDRRLGTAPWLLLIGLLLTFVAIGYNLYDLARTPTPKPAARPTTRPKKSWDDWDREERERDGDRDDDEYGTRAR